MCGTLRLYAGVSARLLGVIAKNLVLTGIKSLTLHDNDATSCFDLNSQVCRYHNTTGGSVISQVYLCLIAWYHGSSS